MSPRFSSVIPAAACFLLVGTAGAQQFVQQTTALFPTQLEYGNQLTSLDIDDDGDLDIIIANGQGFSSQGAALQLRVYVNRINEAIAKFVDESATRAAGVTGWFRGVEAGDCDGDGDWDLVAAQDFNKQPKLLLNDGFGVFTDATAARLPPMTMSSARAQFGDIDNDGDLDLFFCNSGATNRFGSGQPRLFANDGAGFYSNITATNIPVGNISDQQDCIFGDIDNDLDLDIHVGSRAGASKLWVNDGTGDYVAYVPAINGGGSSYSYDFGDIEGDGDLDLLSIQGGGELLLENKVPLAWANISSEISPNTAIDDNDSKFFDYDNDGDLDYIVGSLGSSERVFRNSGGVPADAGALFTLQAGVMPTVGDSSLDIETCDYNGDNKIDVVTVQGESGGFQDKIYINTTGAADSIAPKIIKVEELSDVEIKDCSPVGPFTIRAIIYDAHTSDRGFYPGPITLNWELDGGGVQAVEMKWYGNSIWRGVIPAQVAPGMLTYSVDADDRAGNTATSATFDLVIAGGLAGDLDGDGDVDGADYGLFLAEWDNTSGPGDLNCDGIVDGADAGILLANWSEGKGG